MKFRQAICGLSFSLCFFLLALTSYAQPSWTSGYPQILSGASSVDIKVQTNSSGTIYYAIYGTVQSGITSAQLKADALGGSNPNLVRRASAAMTANTLQTLKQTGLTDNKTYHIYVVAESSGGLMANNLISYTPRFFPRRQQDFYNFSNSVVAAYLAYFPEDYYKTTTTYPLIVFLGGSGELTHGGAADLNRLRGTGLPYVIDHGKEVPMIVASPQGIFTWAGSATPLDAYIDFLKATYRVNASQIFLTGLSDGGVGVFQYADSRPTKLRGIVPCSTWPSGALPIHFLNLPVWGFMGSLDSHQDMVNFITSLQALGGNARYTEYPGGHGPSVWNSAYDGSRGDDIYQWMQTILGQPPPNSTPIVNAGVDRTVNLPLTQLQIAGTASDVDGTIASYAWTKILGPSVTMTNTNTSLLTLTNISAGTYTFQLRVVDNDGAAATDQITVYVYAPGAVSREFDVNITWATNKQGGTWNDFITTSGGVVGNSTTLFDIHNLPSTVSISITAPFQDGVNNHGVTPGIYPNNVMQYFLRSTQTKVGVLKISGLTVSNTYDLSILSSNYDVWYPSDTRLTANGQSVTVNAKGNANQLANFPAIAPNANGEITITVAPATTASTNIGVINALVIQEKVPVGGNVSPVVSAGPDRQVTLPVSQLQLPGTATDPDGSITSMLWTKISGPAVTLTNATTSTLTLTNLLAGTYVFQLWAQDNSGASASDPITVNVSPAPVGGTREFDINVTWEWNKQNGLPWNDFITTNGGVVGNTKTLVDKDGVSSAIAISITAPFQDGANNHGVIPGMYPNNVMQYYLRSTQSRKGALKLAGLNSAKRYDLSILSSNIDVWYPSDTRLTVQGQAATVNAKSNASQLVNFANIAPTASGEIPILVEPATTNSANVGVINAIILTEHDVTGGRTASPEVAAGNPEQPAVPLEDYVNVFPNPVDDHVNVEISSSLPAQETFSVEFIDVRGAQVYARMLESQDGMNHVSERIPTDFLQSGLYIVAVHSRQNGIKYFKILKK